MKKVHLKTKHGFIFEAKLYNEVSHTHFSCKNWRGLCKAYEFEEGMRITFDIGIPQYDPVTGPQHDKDIWVDLDMIPILPPCEFVKQIC